MSDILLAIDLNHEASWRRALPEAVLQAQMRRGRLHLLAILPDFGMTIVRDYFPADFEKKALKDIHAQLVEFAEKHLPDGVEWEAHVGHGDIDHEILRAAERTGAEMIVMASHPPSELRSLLIGSHADKVVHRSPVSVLVVR